MSKFQRRHYEAIAEHIGYMQIDEASREILIEDFIVMFKRDNSRFQPDRFRERVSQYVEGIIMR